MITSTVNNFLLRNIVAAKVIVFILCLLPFVYLLIKLLLDQLGANPIEVLTRSLGEWGLRFLLITLAVTPVRRLLKQTWLQRLRRMLGLFCFGYVSLHLLSYLWLDQFFWWSEIWSDIVKRPFITVGMLAFVLLIPLAITSNNYLQRALGRRWKRLHQLVYFIAIAAVLHFFWLVKADLREPIIYATILALLLFYRLVDWRKKVATTG